MISNLDRYKTMNSKLTQLNFQYYKDKRESLSKQLRGQKKDLQKFKNELNQNQVEFEQRRNKIKELQESLESSESSLQNLKGKISKVDTSLKQKKAEKIKTEVVVFLLNHFWFFKVKLEKFQSEQKNIQSLLKKKSTAFSSLEQEAKQIEMLIQEKTQTFIPKLSKKIDKLKKIKVLFFFHFHWLRNQKGKVDDPEQQMGEILQKKLFQIDTSNEKLLQNHEQELDKIQNQKVTTPPFSFS